LARATQKTRLFWANPQYHQKRRVGHRALRHQGMNFQILRSYLCVIDVAYVVFGPVPSEVFGEGFLGGLVEAREGGLGGAKILSEESYRFSGGEGIVEEQFLFLSLEAGDFSLT
jgi:hypothetical protein